MYTEDETNGSENAEREILDLTYKRAHVLIMQEKQKTIFVRETDPQIRGRPINQIFFNRGKRYHI